MVWMEVESGQEEGPSSLFPIKLLGSNEILQVLVVGPNLELMFGSFQEVPPFFHRSDNCQHFLVVDLIVSFDRGQGFGQKCNWVPFVINRGLLREYCAGSKVGAISLNPKRSGVVRRRQDWGGSDCAFKRVKSRLLFLSPPPFDIILREVEEWASMMREVFDEPTVEVCEA